MSARTALAADWPELAHRKLVSRIVASPAFSRSERLSTLLTYVCDMALGGREEELNEQKIGHAVFGRSQGYDSSIDGIVRTQASRLRQRLEMYFEQEGSEEPVRIVIPRGGYVPIFVPRAALAEQEPRLEMDLGSGAGQAAKMPQQIEPRPQRTAWLPWILCGILSVFVVTLVARQVLRQATAEMKPPHPLWGRIFVPQQTTLEVPGDSGLVLAHRFHVGDVPLNEYLVGDYRSARSEVFPQEFSAETRAMGIDIVNRRYTSIVDLDAAVALALMAQASQSKLQVRYPRDLRPNDLKSGNIILIGAFEANPWVELFERKMNFVLTNDYKARVFSVINRSPMNGEPAQWDSPETGTQRMVYGVVAFLPSLSRDGNALLVEGISMAGTEAAWDFVSDDSALLPFLKKIARPDGTIPHFELLLATQNMNSSAVRSSVVAWRVHE